MRITIDGTPAAVQQAGVGRYTRELLRALMTLPGQDQYQILTASDPQATSELERTLPPGAWREMRRLPLPERAMTALWQRLRLPLPVEALCGPHDVFHGPDFVLPPGRSPMVVTIHDLSYLRHPELGEESLVGYLRGAVPRSLRRASVVIAVSATVAAELVEAYPSVAGKVRAIPNGVTISPDARRSAPRSNDRPRILVVGTIEPRKNHRALLRAMPYVWEAFPETELVVVGRVGWRADAIVDELNAAACSSAVTVQHAVSDQELESRFGEATVFVYPSLYEGFGLPILEAMGRGVPVVAGDIPSLRETGGDAASYADPANPEAIGAAIVDLLASERKRTALIAAGHRRAAGFTWEQTARWTHKAYSDAVEGQSP